MAKGGKRPGAGRPVGSATKKTRTLSDRLVEEGITPLHYMIGILRNPLTSPEDKRWAAQSAAPYIHPKLAAVTHKGDPESPLEHSVKIYIPSNGRD